MMSPLGRWLRAFGAFWWDFVVGDDWTIAAGVVVALALTGVLAAAAVPAWWLLPVAVLALLAFSLRRGIRGARRK
jgi:hypothetical protein